MSQDKDMRLVVVPSVCEPSDLENMVEKGQATRVLVKGKIAYLNYRQGVGYAVLPYNQRDYESIKRANFPSYRNKPFGD